MKTFSELVGFRCDMLQRLDVFLGLGVIGSVQLDGSGYKELKVGDGLAAVALSDDVLLWMTVTGKDFYIYLLNVKTLYHYFNNH